MSINIKSLSKQLEKDYFLSSKDIRAIINVFPKEIDPDSCEFLLLKCTKDKIREEDFIEFLLDGIIRYTLTAKDYTPKGSTQSERDHWWQKNVLRLAKRAAYQFSNSEHMGELGELFLFMLLESKGIVQLLNKMSLKTSVEMPIHGLDGIHIDVKEDSICLHYCYSKIYSRFARGLDDILDEVNDFHTDRSKQKFEINLVTSKIDEIKFKGHHEEIAQLLSPYYENKEIFSEMDSLFLGYQWDKLRKTPTQGKSLSNYQIEEFKKRFDHIIQQYQSKKSIRSKLNDHKIALYFMPFQDVEGIRELFRHEIKGVE